jgi:hypothetical protein
MWQKTAACLLGMTCAFSYAKEFESAPISRPDRDWLQSDREAVQPTLMFGTAEERAALIKSVASGATKNTFIQTVLPNLLEGRSSEYKTVTQRSALYSALSAILKHHPAVPERLRGIRFFDAAAEVTGPSAIGALERWAPIVKLSETVGLVVPDAREHLEVINAILLKRNFDVLRRAFKDWQELRSPFLEWKGGPSPWPVVQGRMSAEVFDSTMVLFEQETVERYLSSTKMAAPLKASIDLALSACEWYVAKQNWINVSLPLCQAQRWGAEAGVQTKTFFDRQARIATGQALVYSLHGKSKEEYLRLIEVEKAWLGSPKKPSDLIFVGSEKADQNFFAIAGSFKSRRGAERKRAELLAKVPGGQFAIYPPKSPDVYWTVASAAFSSEEEAKHQVLLCRKSGAAPDAYVLSRSPLTRDGKRFDPLPSSIELPQWPTAPGSRPNTIDPDSRLLLELKRIEGKDAATKELAGLKAKFAQAPVAMMDVDGTEKTFALVVGGFTDEIGLARAKSTARLLGYSQQLTTITELPMGPLVGWVDRTAATSLAARSNAQRVIQCYGNGRQTVKEMLDCSGFLLTPPTLVRCFQGALKVEEECFPITLDQIQKTRGLATFLAEQKINLDDVLQVNPEDLPLPKSLAETEAWAKKIYECKQVASDSDQAKYEACILPILPKGALTDGQAKCFADSKGNQANVAICIANATVPVATSMQLDCLSRGKGDQLAQAKCLMSREQRTIASAMQDCIAGVSDRVAAIVKCGVVSLDPQQSDLLACVSSKGQDAQAAVGCAAKLNPDVSKAMSKLDCLRKAAGVSAKQLACATQGADQSVVSAVALAQCANTPNASPAQVTTCLANQLNGDTAKAAAAVTCLKAAGNDSNKQMLCGANAVGGDAAVLAACLAEAGSDRQAMLVCALGKRPEAQVLSAAAKCASVAGDTGQILAQCAAPFLPTEAREAVVCVAKGGYSTGAIAGCGAAQLLPAQYQQLASCAATSSSAVGLAVCAAGPSMNEDLRIAADCAAASGGEPVTFASCAGGRLAVREIMGCLQNKIGEDGCFGKGNTLRQAFEAVGNLYINVAVAAGKALDDTAKSIVKAVQDVGQAAGVAAQQIADVASQLTGGAVGVGDGCVWVAFARVCDGSKDTPVCVFGVCAKK